MTDSFRAMLLRAYGFVRVPRLGSPRRPAAAGTPVRAPDAGLRQRHGEVAHVRPRDGARKLHPSLREEHGELLQIYG